MPTARIGILIATALLLPACRSLSRDINSSLPGIFRSEPGKEELERLAVLRRGKVEITPEEQAARLALVDAARAAYAEQRWDDAAELFEDFIDEYPGTDFDEECRFFRAEARYRDDEFSSAYAAYKSFALNFPVSDQGRVVEERLYDIGRDYLEGNQSAFFGIFGNRSKGVEILDYLVDTYPNAERADDSKWLVAKYHMDDDEWDKAGLTFDFLVKQYPKSEWRAAAKWFSAYCNYRRVKGDIYDPLVIDRTRELFMEYLTDFPDGEWAADARQIVEEMDLVASQRMLNVAEWYLDQDKPYSARYYLLRVTRLWPASEAAKRAQDLYAEVASAVPETPEERLILEQERAERTAREAERAAERRAGAAAESAPASRPETRPGGR